MKKLFMALVSVLLLTSFMVPDGDDGNGTHFVVNGLSGNVKAFSHFANTYPFLVVIVLFHRSLFVPP